MRDAVARALAELKALHRVAPPSRRAGAGRRQRLAFEGRCSANAPPWSEARALLQQLRASEHLLVSAAALARDGASALAACGPAACDARLQPAIPGRLSGKRRRGHLSSVGCYQLEGRGAQLFDTVEGDYFSVLGLPLLPLLAALRKQGVLAS